MKTTSFSISKENEKKIQEIKRHLQEKTDVLTEDHGLQKRKVTQSEVLNYSILRTYEELLKEGYIEKKKMFL